jgi:hypothetical protein
MEPPVIPPGLSGDQAKAFRQALAHDPDDRPLTLVEFLVALVDAWPLEPLARERIAEMFRHDDYAGDIVPIRPLRAGAAGRPTVRRQPWELETVPTSQMPESGPEPAAGGRTGEGRGIAGRPVPSLPQAPAVRIELEEGPRGPQRPPLPDRRPRHAEEPFLTPKKLVKWIIAVLVLGPLFWWAYRILQPYLPGN